MSIESALSSHAARVRYEDLPDEARLHAKLSILWALGTAFAGSGMAGAREVMDIVHTLSQGCAGTASLIGVGGRAPMLMAGFANGVFAKAAEYEDKLWMDNTHGYGIGHAVVPAAFAACEHFGHIDGKTLLAAVAVATDVQGRMVVSVPQAINTPFNSAYLFSHFGAAVVVGRLLNFDEEKMANALGMAYQQAAGNFQAHHEHNLAIRMQTGYCVRNGIFAAVMANCGVDGPHQFLTGKAGLYAAMFNKEFDGDAVTRDLGELFMGTRVGYKAYPCGAVVHPALDAVLQIHKANGLGPEMIKAVEIHGSVNLNVMSEPLYEKQRPQNHVDQEFSLPWAIACALSEGRVSIGHFREAALQDKVKLDLAQKVTVSTRAGSNETRAVIHLTDGRTLCSTAVGPPTGHQDNRLTLDEFFERYRDCMQFGPKAVSDSQVEKARQRIMNLEDVKDAAEIIRLFN